MFSLVPNPHLHKKIELSSFTIEKTAKLMKQSFARILLSHTSIDVTVDQWVIMQLVNKNGEMSQNHLAAESHKDAPTVTKIIDLLVKKGYLIRKVAHDDRRKFMVYLTKKGQQMVNKIMPLVYDFRNKCYQEICEEELRTLELILNKIEYNLTQPQPNKL